MRKIPWTSLIGLLLLALLLWKLDVGALARVMQRAQWPLLIAAIALNIPMVFFKAWRWRLLLRAQQIAYPLRKTYLAYFGSIFIGFVTPGRLGEFVKALHIKRDCGVPIGSAFSSVLADRIFDLAILMGVGGMGFASVVLPFVADGWLTVVLLSVGIALPLWLLANERSYGWFDRRIRATRARTLWHRVNERGLTDLRHGLRTITLPVVGSSAALTLLAYLVFFVQCYMVALAVGLSASFVQVSYAVAMGSLITLIPISISGIGTRDAAIVAYLGSLGIASEAALGFSLLIFVTFYIAGGLMGAVAWLMQPAPLAALRQRAAGGDESGSAPALQ